MELEWGEDTLRFELTPADSGTVLVLADTLGQLGKAARDGAGWHECLDKLAYALDGVEVPWDEAERGARSIPATSNVRARRLDPRAARGTSGDRLTRGS